MRIEFNLMKTTITRDSVAYVDDIDAPHEITLSLNVADGLHQLLKQLTKRKYLPTLQQNAC